MTPSKPLVDKPLPCLEHPTYISTCLACQLSNFEYEKDEPEPSDWPFQEDIDTGWRNNA